MTLDKYLLTGMVSSELKVFFKIIIYILAEVVFYRRKYFPTFQTLKVLRKRKWKGKMEKKIKISNSSYFNIMIFCKFWVGGAKQFHLRKKRASMKNFSNLCWQRTYAFNTVNVLLLMFWLTFSTLYLFHTLSSCIQYKWDKVLKDGPSKICGRQSLKNLKW